MASEETYPVQIDESIGRAYVQLTGLIVAAKVRNTFFEISLNTHWLNGERSILWSFLDAVIPEHFEFVSIFQHARTIQSFTKPGKSAAVLEKNSEMQKRVSTFYRDIAETFTERQIRFFNTTEEAVAWLDS